MRDLHTGESDGGGGDIPGLSDGDKALLRNRREKAKITKVREGIQILGTLFVVGLFVVGGLFVAFKTDDASAEPAMRVEMWCTGYASGFAQSRIQQGFSPPYSNEWEALIGQCTDGIFYLETYPIQRGVSPPNPQDIFWDDVAPPGDTQCLPSLLRQC